MLELHYSERGKKLACIITQYNEKTKEMKTLYHAVINMEIENTLQFLCDTKEIYLRLLEAHHDS